MTLFRLNPVFNTSDRWRAWLLAFLCQTMQCVSFKSSGGYQYFTFRFFQSVKGKSNRLLRSGHMHLHTTVLRKQQAALTEVCKTLVRSYRPVDTDSCRSPFRYKSFEFSLITVQLYPNISPFFANSFKGLSK